MQARAGKENHDAWPRLARLPETNSRMRQKGRQTSKSFMGTPEAARAGRRGLRAQNGSGNGVLASKAAACGKRRRWVCSCAFHGARHNPPSRKRKVSQRVARRREWLPQPPLQCSVPRPRAPSRIPTGAASIAWPQCWASPCCLPVCLRPQSQREGRAPLLDPKGCLRSLVSGRRLRCLY